VSIRQLAGGGEKISLEEDLLLSQSSTDQDLKQVWGEWISGLAEWDWFVTMTFRDPRPSAGTWTKPGWGLAKKAWRNFLEVSTPAIDARQWVRCFEVQKWRGVPHIHALVAGVDPSVRRMDMVDWCWREYGMARVLQYDPGLGAGYYLCKYLTKELGDIDFGGF